MRAQAPSITISYVQSQVARCLGVLLESKPVSYSWFPSHLGPQVSNPRFRREAHAHYLATNETSHKFQRVEYMVLLSGTDIRGEEHSRWRW